MIHPRKARPMTQEQIMDMVERVRAIDAARLVFRNGRWYPNNNKPPVRRRGGVRT